MLCVLVSSRNPSLEYEQERKDEEHKHSDEYNVKDSHGLDDKDEDDDVNEHHELKWTDCVEDLRAPLTSSSEGLAELNGPRFLSHGDNVFDFYLGLRKIHLALHEQAVTYCLRPDVTADSVFGLIEQVGLSGGCGSHPRILCGIS